MTWITSATARSEEIFCHLALLHVTEGEENAAFSGMKFA
jgi:hypothetical protein